MEDSAKFFDKDLDKLSKKFSENAKGDWSDEPAIMKAGQIAFHHGLTFHGSGPNITDLPRYAIAVHMQPDNCFYQTGKGWHHNVKDLGPFAKHGDRFVGPTFPVLYSKKNTES